LKIGDTLHKSRDTITQKKVVDLKSVVVKYSCPWITDSNIFSFLLTIFSPSIAKQWKIGGGLIPNPILEEIKILRPLNAIYIDNIRRTGLHHHQTKNIVIYVKGKS